MKLFASLVLGLFLLVCRQAAGQDINNWTLKGRVWSSQASGTGSSTKYLVQMVLEQPVHEQQIQVQCVAPITGGGSACFTLAPDDCVVFSGFIQPPLVFDVNHTPILQEALQATSLNHLPRASCGF